MNRLLTAFLCLCLTTCVLSSERGLNDLKLRDCYGQQHQLPELLGKRYTVIAFLGTECPLARLYGPRLRELAARFDDEGIAFIGVNSNVQDSLTEVLAYANRARIKFPMLLDTEHRLADLLEATRTPEVMVLDAEQNIRYRGRIDNQYAISVKRSNPTVEDLANALTDLLNGREPRVTRTEAIGCVIGRRSVKPPTGEITYSKHIAPIFNKACVECHREGEIAPFPLTSFEDTIGWADTIAEVIEEGRMPPWNANPEFGHFRNDARLTAQEKHTIRTWIRNGTPKGDTADLPPAPTFVSGWRISKPDREIEMPATFKVPATGVVDYKYFVVDPELEEDVYVNAVEARPGNPEVVHHIVVYMRKPGARRRGLGDMLIGYAPGTSPLIYPEDAGMRVPAGTQFIFEMHYTPNGESAEDKSYFGMKLIDKENVKREIIGSQAINGDFKIQPHARNQTVTASRRIREDLSLITLTPHMHLRGKSFRYEVRHPGGKRETILDVPRYDFNWQLRYELTEPYFLPRGSVLECTAVFDNSEANPNNPDPTKTVKWGQQSWEEMMIGFYTAVRPMPQKSETGAE